MCGDSFVYSRGRRYSWAAIRGVFHMFFFSRELAVGGWSGSGSDPGIAGVWSVERECIIGAG